MTSISKPTIFLLAGRTGGPIMPVLAIAENLKNIEPIILGVQGGFESILARQYNYIIEYLPQAKQHVQNTENIFIKDRIIAFFRTFRILFLLSISVFKSIFLIFKYRPKVIITAGSFLAIPLALACNITRIFGLSPRWIVHQQDVMAGKSNLYVAGRADILTVAFQASKKNKHFGRAIVIPNPLDRGRFDVQNLLRINRRLQNENLPLYSLLHESGKPLLFVFGGGSGSLYLNQFIWNNLTTLLKKFRIIHLTGALIHNDTLASGEGYYTTDYLSFEQPLVLNKASVVISRSGMGTIAELLYLQKPGFLLPLPNTHQLQNAQSVDKFFTILKHSEVIFSPQSYHKEWVKQLLNWQSSSRQKKLQDRVKMEKLWQNYLKRVQSLVELD